MPNARVIIICMKNKVLPDFYAADAEHLALYAQMAATEAGFADYLDKYVYEKRAA